MQKDNLNESIEPMETQYVDEFGNPIDPSLIDEFGNYIGGTTQYVDEFGNPIDPSLIDEFGNYIGPNPNNMANAVNQSNVADALANAQGGINKEEIPIVSSASEHQMDDKEILQGMVTFDYNNVPITDIVNSIILDAINKGASDIHFDPFDDGIKIRIRIDGQLNDYSIVPLFVKKNMITRIKIISGMNITESRTPQDGAIRTELADKTIDLRVSCLPTNMGEKIVIRIMDYSMSASGVEALDFNEKNLEKVKKMLALPNGIILVTGATGSGKSTTVYSMLQKLNVEGTNLITVEDPIEMNIGGVNQVQAVSEIGLDFATVLRSILRQDPDVIMIGEIRDDETARIAVRASITGHLVLSTIHTNNSLNTIERLTDMSVERYLLGTALSGIVSQKLARRLCDKCKRLRPANDYEKEVFKKALDKDINEIYEPVGCPHCSRGYRGRIAIQEVLLLNQTIQDAITKGVPKDILRNFVYGDEGTETMLQDGLQKVLDGKTSFDEIIKLIDLEDDLGTGTQLGLNDQLNASQMANNIPMNNVGAPVQALNLGNNPININITPELLSGLSGLGNLKNLNIEDDDDDDDEVEVIRKPKKRGRPKKKKIVEEDIESLDEEAAVTFDAPIIEDDESLEELPDEVNDTTEDNNDIEIFDVENYDKDLEHDNIDTLEITELPEEEAISSIEPIANLDNVADEVIEELDNSLPNKDIDNSLYEELLNTKNQMNKPKYVIKVKEILDKIKNSDIITTPVPDNVLEYIKEIEETHKLDYKKKKNLINKFNEVFSLNEQLDKNIDDKTDDSINFLDDLEELNKAFDNIDGIDFNEDKFDLDKLDDLDDLDISDLEDEIPDFSDEEIEVLKNIDFNNLINDDVTLQDDYLIEDNDLVIDENDFNAIDDSILNSMLDNIGDFKEDEEI